MTGLVGGPLLVGGFGKADRKHQGCKYLYSHRILKLIRPQWSSNGLGRNLISTIALLFNQKPCSKQTRLC